MGAGMCKDIVPGASVGGVGRGGTCPASGGCRDTVDRAMERILHRKTQVIHGSNISSRPNGLPLTSSSSPTSFTFPDQSKRPQTLLKGPRTPPTGNGEGTNSLPHLRSDGPPNPASSAPDKPPVRPPRKKDHLRKPAPPLPRRNQSAVTLSSQVSPEATAADLDIYLKRCHSMGTVPALLDELKTSKHGSSLSSLATSSLESRNEEMQIPVVIPQDRLPSFASVTPPPSPSSTPPGDENVFTHAPHFFIGSRGRSPSSSHEPETPSPSSMYVDLWTSGKAKGPLIRRDEDGMQDLIRKLRRVRSHGESDQQEHSYKRVDNSGVSPLAEHVIDILPTRCAGPPRLSTKRSSSTPQLASAPSGTTEADRNNPRTILLKILGQYHCLPGSGALARKGKRGEEDELAAIEKQLDATWGHLKRSSSKMEGKGEEEEEGKKKSRTKDEEDDDTSSSSVTPSLGELEEALAHMLDEDDWEEKEEERASRAKQERVREDLEDRATRVAEEMVRSQERMVREERLKEEGETGGSVMALRMKRENTFTALSELSKDE